MVKEYISDQLLCTGCELSIFPLPPKPLLYSHDWMS